MDLRNYVHAESQQNGWVFSLSMPFGSTFKAAIDAVEDIKKQLEASAAAAEEAAKAQAEESEASEEVAASEEAA